MDRLLNVAHAWALGRLREGHGEEAQERLDSFSRLMEGDPIASGDEAAATAYEARPEVQARQHGMMGMAQMAPPHDPTKTGPPPEGGAQSD